MNHNNKRLDIAKFNNELSTVSISQPNKPSVLGYFSTNEVKSACTHPRACKGFSSDPHWSVILDASMRGGNGTRKVKLSGMDSDGFYRRSELLVSESDLQHIMANGGDGSANGSSGATVIEGFLIQPAECVMEDITAKKMPDGSIVVDAKKKGCETPAPTRTFADETEYQNWWNKMTASHLAGCENPFGVTSQQQAAAAAPTTNTAAQDLAKLNAELDQMLAPNTTTAANDKPATSQPITDKDWGDLLAVLEDSTTSPTAAGDGTGILGGLSGCDLFSWAKWVMALFIFAITYLAQWYVINAMPDKMLTVAGIVAVVYTVIWCLLSLFCGIIAF